MVNYRYMTKKQAASVKKLFKSNAAQRTYKVLEDVLVVTLYGNKLVRKSGKIEW